MCGCAMVVILGPGGFFDGQVAFRRREEGVEGLGRDLDERGRGWAEAEVDLEEGG